jgi:glycosyltransferase involved in cell wall biosynthesis
VTSVVIVIPACNEGPDFGANLVRFADYFGPYRRSYDLSYVIVDDGSTDDTLRMSHHFARYRRNVTVISHDRRYGIGRSLHSAFLRLCAKYTIVIDGGATYPAAAAMELLETLENTGADLAVASPYTQGADRPQMPFARRIAARFTNRILSLLVRERCASFTCILRAFRTEFLKSLQFTCEGDEAVPELMIAAIRAGGHIVELRTRLDWSMAASSAALAAHPQFVIPQEGLQP